MWIGFHRLADLIPEDCSPAFRWSESEVKLNGTAADFSPKIG
jgi:hypothetical protein